MIKVLSLVVLPVLTFSIFAADEPVKKAISEATQKMVDDTVGTDSAAECSLVMTLAPTGPKKQIVFSNGLTPVQVVDQLLMTPQTLTAEHEQHMRSTRATAQLMEQHIAAAGELMKGVVFDMGEDSPKAVASRELTSSRDRLLKLVRSVQDGPMGVLSRWTENALGNGTANLLSRFLSNEDALRTIIVGMGSGKEVLLLDNIAAERYRIYLEELLRALKVYGAEQELVLKEIERRKALAGSDPRLPDYEHRLVTILARIERLRLTYNVTIAALTKVIDSNRKEVENVEGAEQATLPALTAGVALKSALERQRQVIDNRRLLERTTTGLLKDIEMLLKEQSQMVSNDAESVVTHMADLRGILDGITSTIVEDRRRELESTASLKAAVNELAQLNANNELTAGALSLQITDQPLKQ